MKTRYVLPAATALSLHAFLLFGFRHAPRTATPGLDVPSHPNPVILDFLDPPEVQDGPAAAPHGEPDVIRSEEPPAPPNPVFPVPPPIMATNPGPVEISPRVPSGPIGDPHGVGDLPGSDVVSAAYLDNTPRMRVQVAPAYPYEAKKGGRTGGVVVEFTVDEGGRVLNPRVLRSTDPVFEDPTLRAVAKWRFEPGRRNGRAVRFRMEQVVQFMVTD